MNTDQVPLKIEKLRENTDIFIKLGDQMLRAYDASLYPFDIFVNSILHRSLNLTLGFCDLIEKRNIICAGPLLRLQIDNCLRLYAGFIVSDPHKFALDVLEGNPINKMKDKNGKKMSDHYLVEQLSFEESWIQKVYRETSGYIHFSEKHIFNTIRPAKDIDMTVEMVIAKDDPFIPDNIYIEILDAFSYSTELLLKYIKGWIFTKENPEQVQSIKKAYVEKFGEDPDCRSRHFINATINNIV